MNLITSRHAWRWLSRRWKGELAAATEGNETMDRVVADALQVRGNEVFTLQLEECVLSEWKGGKG